MRISVFLLAAAGVLTLAGCNKPASTKSAEDEAVTTASPAAVAGTGAQGGSVGIAECDQYLTKVKACLADHVPQAQRAAFNQALDGSRDQWLKAAAQPGGKDALAASCKQANDAAKTSFAAFGCKF